MDCMCVLVGALVHVYVRVRTCRPSLLKASAVTLCVCVSGGSSWRLRVRPGGGSCDGGCDSGPPKGAGVGNPIHQISATGGKNSTASEERWRFLPGQ